MKIFSILGIIIAGTVISGEAGTIGAVIAVAFANCYKIFD